MILPKHPVLRIGAWRADPALDEISNDGATVKLEPRAMRVLVCLAERAGQVVSVEELLDAVWKDVIVTPDSVYRVVSELRRALGDDPKEPVYIANVLRRGYRLVAPVGLWVGAAQNSNPEERPAGAASTPPATTAESAPSRVRWTWAMLVVAVVMAIGYPIAKNLWPPKPGRTTEPVTTAMTVSIDEHSVAVLPFLDMSEKKDQEYFSDGLSEELIYHLGQISALRVPARTSSFYFKGRSEDIPTIARRLRVAHVLEGSVRKEGDHVRITVQLVRADNGYHLWSQTYDRKMNDILKVQDEIANAVVKALNVSLLGGTAPESLGTQNSDAYLALLQGRAKMATERLANFKAAAIDFTHALKLDPNYAPAYVELANANLQLAEFEKKSGRLAAVESALNEAKLLVGRALALDTSNAQAYIVRGYLREFSGDPGAEKDLRRGIELDPNSARGYAGLATLLYEDPFRRDEALAMLEQAQRLDPLDADYQIQKGKFLFMGRDNLREADALFADLVAHHPTFPPAVQYLAFVRFAEGNFADAIMYGEQAVKLDPLAEGILMDLIRTYSDIGDTEAARQVADEAPRQLPIRYLPVLIREGNWHQAAAITYASERIPVASESQAVFVLRLDAHRTHDFRRARAVFEQACGVTWSAEGIPTLPPQTGFGYACVALGDMLIASGDRTRGERLLRVSLADMDYAVHELKRGEFWYMTDKATALALLGDRRAALAALHTAVGAGYITTWSLIELDPAFDFLRGDAEFQSLMRIIAAKKAHERQILAQMRSDGRVPDRSGPTAPKAHATGPGSG